MKSYKDDYNRGTLIFKRLSVPRWIFVSKLIFNSHTLNTVSSNRDQQDHFIHVQPVTGGKISKRKEKALVMFRSEIVTKWKIKIKRSNVRKKLLLMWWWMCAIDDSKLYYPTLLPRVQISRETSTNNRYLYSSQSWPREVQNLGKSEFWEKKSLDNKSLIRRFGV